MFVVSDLVKLKTGGKEHGTGYEKTDCRNT